MEKTQKNLSWKAVQTADDAKQLIDIGALLRDKEMKALTKALPMPIQEEIVRYFAVKIAERHEMRLQLEILVESVLLWLTSLKDESLMHAFLKSFFAQPGADEASWTFVEVALTGEISEHKKEREMFEMAVSLVCELGIGVFEYENSYPGEFQRASAFLDHIATYLLSVSNANSNCVRLSLIHYFGITEQSRSNRLCFNRVMSRFGHTVLEHLFDLLFRKKSEAVALQYLLENLPFVLDGDRHCQVILHETFKHYMLKQPDRFNLFVHALAKEMHAEHCSEQSVANFIQHLGALLNVISEVNHRQLGKEVLIALIGFKTSDAGMTAISVIQKSDKIRKPFKELLDQLLGSEKVDQAAQSMIQFRSNKRGRKPAFARKDGMGFLNQITYLGGVEAQKAS